MDLLLIKRLLQDNILDFDKLVLAKYKTVGLSETEAMLLIELRKQSMQGSTRLQPMVLSESFKLSLDHVYTVLDRLIQGGFLTIDIVKNEEGKETEVYSLEHTAQKMLSEIEKQLELERAQLSKTYATIEEAIVDLLETNLQKQLVPLEIEIIQKWVSEYHYDFLSIRQAVLDTVKANRQSLSYTDSLLMKRFKAKLKKTELTPTAEKPEALKTFFDSWPKE
ncbi:MAG: DnaD domain protein [Bacillus subtilis]|nr:DnaD domain protein [Bacillus subtilis]